MDFGYWFAQSEKTSVVTDLYQIGPEIGRGPFTVVHEGTQIGLGKKWALKHFVKKSFPKQQRQLDIGMLFKPYHDNVIRLKNVYETPSDIWMVYELISTSSMNIFERFSRREDYSEKEISKAVRQVLRALKYLHQQCDLVHKDVQPRNILFAGDGDDDIVKLDNFANAFLFPDDVQVESVCGNPEFCAPEVINGQPPVAASDLWALGVITYTLLSGQNPFASDNAEETYRKLIKAQYNFDGPVWDEVSKNGKNFVRRLLQLDPAQRMTVDEAMKHYWITGGAARGVQLQSARSRFMQYLGERMQQDDSWWVSRLPMLAPAPPPAEESSYYAEAELEEMPLDMMVGEGGPANEPETELEAEPEPEPDREPEAEPEAFAATEGEEAI